MPSYAVETLSGKMDEFSVSRVISYLITRLTHDLPRSVSGSHLISNTDRLPARLDCLALSLLPTKNQVVTLSAARLNTEPAVGRAHCHPGPDGDHAQPMGGRVTSAFPERCRSSNEVPLILYAPYKPASNLPTLPPPLILALRAGPPLLHPTFTQLPSAPLPCPTLLPQRHLCVCRTAGAPIPWEATSPRCGQSTSRRARSLHPSLQNATATCLDGLEYAARS